MWIQKDTVQVRDDRRMRWLPVTAPLLRLDRTGGTSSSSGPSWEKELVAPEGIELTSLPVADSASYDFTV